MQQNTDTLCATQWQMNPTTFLLQDITTFDRGDTSKLEDLLSDIETAADILGESCAHLAKAKSWGPTGNLVQKALQAGKSWDIIWDIHCLKLCNANIHTYTTCFMEIQQKENKMLAAYIHLFKMEAKRCDFNNDIAAIWTFHKGLKDAHNVAEKMYKKDPQTSIRSN